MTVSTAGHTRLPAIFILDTFGGIAVSSLLICIISGIVLAVPFEISDPYLSVSSMVLSNPWAVIARNMHYWSAQVFFIFSLLHTWDHLRIGTEKGISSGVWIRLCIAIPVIFYAMLSGFILKGDADSEQASLIFRNLISEIPLAGKYLAYVLLGPENSYLLLYVNHIALATIFILFVSFEHSRIIWGKAITFFALLPLMLVMSLLFQAPLHDGLSGMLKGPWYLLGLQEMLHWMHQPAWVWLIILIALLPLFILPFLRQRPARLSKYFLLLALAFYAVLTLIGYFFRGEEWKWSWTGNEAFAHFDPVPVKAASFAGPVPAEIGGYGRTESCMMCHRGMKGFSAAHSPDAIGCVSCHLGNPFTPDKDLAHAGMLTVPGNLENASRTCGTSGCHPDITLRIHTTLMSTNSGIISVDRFVFNELPSPEGYFRVSDVGHSPADQHLRNLCLRCHLGNPKNEPGPVNEDSRGGGCNACHLNYSDSAHRELLMYYGRSMADSSLWSMHPSLSLNITDAHCFGCHSRSGRISTSYEGWHETLMDRDSVRHADTLRILDDGRVFRYISDDVHHAAGLQCIDCHDSYELMGDGKLYMHKEDQVMVRCEDCHFDEVPSPVRWEEVDPETQKILQLKGRDADDSLFLPLGHSGRLIWNSRWNSPGRPLLLGKVSGRPHALNPPAGICGRGDAHDALTCQSCHTAWVPSCIGCHNEYDPVVAGYDMIDQRYEKGSWVEYVGLYLADLPALGVVEDTVRRVHTFTPGMVLSIDKASYDEDAEEALVFKRLYAPISAHTTVSQGRSCRSCHNNPLALGYGQGVLAYEVGEHTGKWEFFPRFAGNEHDGLPEDAWIPFLHEASGQLSTRTNSRPFSLEEQKSILLVGACLECHGEDSDVMMSTLRGFEDVLERRSAHCILPGWLEPQ